jgi:hypothetical protein
VDIYELEISGYYDISGGHGGGAEDICTENVLTHKEVSGGSIITASDTYTTHEVWNSPSPNALIDGSSDCSLRTRWRSGATIQSHYIQTQTIHPIWLTGITITAPQPTSCSSWESSYVYYSFYIQGSTDGSNWYYLTYGYLYAYPGVPTGMDYYAYSPYKYFRIYFDSQSQVEVGELAIRGCYYPTRGGFFQNEQANNFVSGLKHTFGSTASGIAVITGVCVGFVVLIVAIVVVVRKKIRANTEINQELVQKLEIEQDYQKL